LSRLFHLCSLSGTPGGISSAYHYGMNLRGKRVGNLFAYRLTFPATISLTVMLVFSNIFNGSWRSINPPPIEFTHRSGGHTVLIYGHLPMGRLL
jgi:hypothetical protein